MGNTYSQIYIHLVFSTKHRKPNINEEFEEGLTSCIVNSANKHQFHILAVGGTANHIHALANLPPKIKVSKVAQIIKGCSSKWLNDHYFNNEKFRWQRGYGAFSINKSLIPTTIKYIERQKEHHMDTSYQEEFKSFLDKHRIEYDPTRL